MHIAQSTTDKLGTLYIIATPIGNRQDITLRAIDVLKGVDRIAAEDTRHAMHLLEHFAIKKPMISFHQFNEEKRLEVILNYLKAGESIALVSDAGTPLVSDPGFQLVQVAHTCGIRVIPIPGACALIAALSAAGLPTDRFIFEGFLSSKREAREKRLRQLSHEPRTLIFYEAPHRLLVTLQSFSTVFGGERQLVIARELTKLYEQITMKSIAGWIKYYDDPTERVRGEIVLLLRGIDDSVETEVDDKRAVTSKEALAILLKELPLKQAVSLACEITGERRNVLYDWALKFKSE